MHMEKIVFASNNANKLKEIRELLPEYEILTLKDVGFNSDVEETGTTFLANAYIKSKAVYEYLKSQSNPIPVMADDSGLCVTALEGAPGIYSARYASTTNKNAQDSENRKKLLAELEGVVNRKANFSCAVVLYVNENDIHFGTGKTCGEISYAESGNLAFGYDPIFYSYDLEEKFSEVSDEEKNSVSHRARAIADLFQRNHKLTTMKLRPEYFESIVSGEKTIEVRLNDEKRKSLKPGDLIAFRNTEDGEIAIATITNLKTFSSFESCVCFTGTRKIGFNGYLPSDTIEEYRKIYTREEEQKYGVLAIELKLLKAD